MLITKIYYENNIKYIIIKLIYNLSIIGIIQAVIIDKCCTINLININNKYQNLGYGTLILSKLIDYCKNNKIINILLDDMSDRFNEKNNIYIKNGFKYLQKDFPEMILKL
jgi:hypothetical protein